MDTIPEQVIEEALRFDPLNTAKKITEEQNPGGDYTPLGFVLHTLHTDKKNAMLIANGDTTLSNRLDRYLEIAFSIGFRTVLTLPFTHENNTETFYVLYRNPGVILHFDTYCGSSVNGGSFYYNWIPNEDNLKPNDVTSSGQWRKNDEDVWVWVGDHDCREALKHHMSRLETYGKFLNPWQFKGHKHLCHHADWRELSKLPIDALAKEANRRTRERWAMLPADVQAVIPPHLWEE